MFGDAQKKVLIVEDDTDYRRNLVTAIYNEFTVLEAVDGEDAIEKIMFHRPNAIVLDLLLPKLDGFEVLNRIRHYPDEQIASIPVVVLSNLAGNQDALAAQSLKIDAYFVKSNTDLQEVQFTIRQVIEARKTAK